VMKRKTEEKQATRLTDEQLRRSRSGRLGRFPSPDLFEPDSIDEDPKRRHSQQTRHHNNRNEESRKRSAAIGLG